MEDCPSGVAPRRSSFRLMADGLLPVNFSFVKGVNISALVVCFCFCFFVLIYSGIFTSVIMETMSSTCVSIRLLKDVVVCVLPLRRD